MPLVASASSQGQCMTVGPLDVCKTPSPGGPVPLPYPDIGMCSDGDGCSKVKVKGKKALRKGDKLSKSMGDNAGTAGGGAKSSKFMGNIIFKDGNAKVKVKGKAWASHLAKTQQNNGNTMGMFQVPSQ